MITTSNGKFLNSHPVAMESKLEMASRSGFIEIGVMVRLLHKDMRCARECMPSPKKLKPLVTRVNHSASEFWVTHGGGRQVMVEMLTQGCFPGKE